jgi:signal transduction histidine kinase
MGPTDAPTVADAGEAERLEALRELGLDGEPETPDLTGIPQLAAQVCDRPWAGVSLVQEDTHRFIASNAPFPDVLPRKQSLCSRAIEAGGSCVVVNDITVEPPYDRIPIPEEYELRFYAGAPLRSPGGHELGTVCVMDQEPGSLEEPTRQALSTLSSFVSLHLALHQRTNELQAANEELSRFTSFVSHELTDPLSQILSNLDMLTADLAEGPVEEDVRDLAQQALAGARWMDRLVKDLLRYAQTSDRRLEVGEVDLRATAEDAADMLEHRIEGGTRAVRVGDLPMVQADANLLRRVVENLVRNALQHGEPPVEIHGEDEGEAWRICVDDHGPGLSRDERQELFELFATGGGSRSSSGIGLALCERIVHRHGGDIGAKAAPTGGARFWFTLPKDPVNGAR